MWLAGTSFILLLAPFEIKKVYLRYGRNRIFSRKANTAFSEKPRRGMIICLSLTSINYPCCNITPHQIVINIERMKKLDFRNDVLPLKNSLFRLALRVTLDKAEAEDVVQETLIKVWERLDEWENVESLEALCLTICRNLALDKLKAAERRNTLKADDTADAENKIDRSYGANPVEQAEQHDRVALVRGIIDRLPEKQRSVMQLREIEGKSYKEIAAVLGISEEQVKVNIFRARQTVKQKFMETENYGL